MTVRRVALVLVLLVVSSTVAVGATTPTPTATADGEAPLGLQLTEFMQASAAQADGAVGNGLWVAAFATTANESQQRALVEARVGSINASLAELRAEHQALEAAYRNGSIDRITYRARLSAIVGQLAALSDGIEETSDRGRAVGVNETRLDTLRTQARELGGGEVSELARNLTGGHDPPGHAGVFGDDHPGQAGDRKPDDPGPGTTVTLSPGGTDVPGQGPPTDRERGPPARNGTGTETPTPTPTPAEEGS